MNDETYDLINQPDEAPSQTVPAGPVTEDLPCRHCGYNLRGMTEDRACPECGTAVGRSLLGDQLRFSDPQWVRTLARGTKWILTSVLLGFGIGLLGVVITIAYANSPSHAPPPSVAAGLTVAGFVPSVIYLIGILFITAPEPGVIESADWSLRNVLRWAAVATTTIGVIHAGLTLSVTDQIVATVVALASSVVGIVGYISLFVYARRLALRVPDYDLAKQTKTVMWGVLVSLSGMIVVGIVAAVFGAAGSGAGLAVAAIPACALGVAYVVFAIWSLVLLFHYNRAASTAAEQAEQTWANEIVSLPVGGTY